MGGGGPSGKIEFAQSIQDFHDPWLTILDTLLDTEIAGASPYDSKNAFDPTAALTPTAGSPLQDAQLDVDSLRTVVAAINDETDWDNFIDNAVVKADNVLVNTSDIAAARTAFNNRSETDFITGVNQLSGWAGGSGAVDSSAFSIGLYMLQTIRDRVVDDFDQNLTLELQKMRGNFLIQGTQQMISILAQHQGGLKSVSDAQNNTSNMTMIAKKEQVDRDLEIDVLDVLHDFKVTSYCANMMAAPGGGTMVPQEPSPLISALSGALSGAAAGAPLGPAGAIGGGIAGGLIGAFG